MFFCPEIFANFQFLIFSAFWAENGQKCATSNNLRYVQGFSEKFTKIREKSVNVGDLLEFLAVGRDRMIWRIWVFGSPWSQKNPGRSPTKPSSSMGQINAEKETPLSLRLAKFLTVETYKHVCFGANVTWTQ